MSLNTFTDGYETQAEKMLVRTLKLKPYTTATLPSTHVDGSVMYDTTTDTLVVSDGTDLSTVKFVTDHDFDGLIATGTVTSAEILALNATPIELIAAPGASKAIIVDEIQLFLDYGAADYVADAGEDLTIEYGTSGTDIAVIDNDAVTFLTASADAQWLGKNFAIYDCSVAGTGDGVLLSGFDNEAVNITIATGEVITGDSDIKYQIKYHVVDYLV